MKQQGWVQILFTQTLQPSQSFRIHGQEKLEDGPPALTPWRAAHCLTGPADVVAAAAAQTSWLEGET